MKIPHYFHNISQIGPVYLVGGSVRDAILDGPSHDHDFAVPGDAKAFTEKVATQLGARMIAIGKNDKIVYRVVSGSATFDFSPMDGHTIEEDLKKRDFTINGLAYDLREQRLIDPVGALGDIASKTIRLISENALLTDPLRMLRAFRFAALLDFRIVQQTLTAIKAQGVLIGKTAGERISAEMFKIMEAERSFPYIDQMSQAGLLVKIIPELERCHGCLQNERHEDDVFEHTMGTYEALEEILSNCEQLWPAFAKPLESYLERNSRKICLKWAALLHDAGKPQTRSIDSAGRVRFLRHEIEGALIAQAICTRLKMSVQDRSYVTFIVEKHLRPLLLFDAYERGTLTAKGLVRFARRYQDNMLGLLIHSLADQHAKGGERREADKAFYQFVEKILAAYFSDLKPQMTLPRLVTGHDLIRHFHLTPSKLFGKLLRKVDEARLAGEVRTKKEAFEMVARLLKLEGDAGLEPAAPSSGGLCSIH